MKSYLRFDCMYIFFKNMWLQQPFIFNQLFLSGFVSSGLAEKDGVSTLPLMSIYSLYNLCVSTACVLLPLMCLLTVAKKTLGRLIEWFVSTLRYFQYKLLCHTEKSLATSLLIVFQAIWDFMVQTSLFVHQKTFQPHIPDYMINYVN